MSAIVQLPSALANDGSNEDIIAAFLKDECRGIGELVETDNNRCYFISIKGFDDETDKVTLRYYNAKNSYLFSAKEIADFKANSSWGMVDNPVIPELEIE